MAITKSFSANTAQQPIMAAGLLDTLKKMFFQGLDNALSRAAEYQEEYGVLKQINNIPIIDENNSEYTLRVKLSPVKEKDGFYYVEAETDAPSFNVSKLHDKTMKLNKSSMNNFNRTLDKIIESQGYSRIVEDDEFSDEVFEEQVKELFDEVESMFASEDIVGEHDEFGEVKIEVELEVVEVDLDTPQAVISADITGVGTGELDGEILFDTVTNEYEIVMNDQDNQLMTAPQLAKSILIAVENYAKANGVSDSDIPDNLAAKTLVAVSLMKEKGSNDIVLTGIQASCDLRAADSIIEEVLENPEFLESLVEDNEAFFVISDDGDSYDVAEVEAIEVNKTYEDIFNAVSGSLNEIQSYKWVVPDDIWEQTAFLYESFLFVSDMLDTLARWSLGYNGSIPTGEGGYIPGTDLIREDDSIDLNVIESKVADSLDQIKYALEFYYPNFTEEELVVVDEYLEKIEQLAAYC